MKKQQDSKDLPEQLAPVVERFGRPMVALVFAAGLGSEATRVLVGASRGDRGMLHAVSTLAQVYNEVSTAYAKERGWTEEMLGECNRAIEVAFSRKLVGPDGQFIRAQ